MNIIDLGLQHPTEQSMDANAVGLPSPSCTIITIVITTLSSVIIVINSRTTGSSSVT